MGTTKRAVGSYPASFIGKAGYAEYERSGVGGYLAGAKLPVRALQD